MAHTHTHTSRTLTHQQLKQKTWKLECPTVPLWGHLWHLSPLIPCDLCQTNTLNTGALKEDETDLDDTRSEQEASQDSDSNLRQGARALKGP